ncbi:hypothetical protein K440DRAFT_623225 [Wilcoxina mikolae CBS 423.85]|nr:hypothetical protein K440DRAFT_623225 [Wilcoxina mikolae CBS 423.85]
MCFILLCVRYGLLLGKSSVPKSYRFEFSIQLLFRKPGEVLLIVLVYHFLVQQPPTFPKSSVFFSPYNLRHILTRTWLVVIIAHHGSELRLLPLPSPAMVKRIASRLCTLSLG